MTRPPQKAAPPEYLPGWTPGQPLPLPAVDAWWLQPTTPQAPGGPTAGRRPQQGQAVDPSTANATAGLLGADDAEPGQP